MSDTYFKRSDMIKNQLSESQFILEKEDIIKLLNTTLNLRDRLIIKLLAKTGLRRDEVRNIEIAGINFQAKSIYIAGKKKKVRYIPVDVQLLSEIRHFIGKQKNGYLFPCPYKDKKNQPITNWTINQIVQDAGERAGVKSPVPTKKHLNPHCFRHTFAHTLFNSGMDVRAIADILGHNDVKTTLNQYLRKPFNAIQAHYERVDFGF